MATLLRAKGPIHGSPGQRLGLSNATRFPALQGRPKDGDIKIDTTGLAGIGDGDGLPDWWELKLLRSAALDILTFEQHCLLNAAFDHYHDYRKKSFKLIKPLSHSRNDQVSQSPSWVTLNPLADPVFYGFLTVACRPFTVRTAESWHLGGIHRHSHDRPLVHRRNHRLLRPWRTLRPFLRLALTP